MEWKIGEIFEFGGEWYQCISYVNNNCMFCDLFRVDCMNIIGHCSRKNRSDKKSVIFKKLEKVGEPYEYFIQNRGIIMVQEYILANPSYIWNDSKEVFVRDCHNGRIAIEIKEDMEEKKFNLKPFDLEATKAGKPVCTRDGRKARIICFDFQSIENTPIVAAIKVTDKQEVIVNYYENGRQFVDGISEIDLMMLPEKKEGWAVIFKDDLLKTEKEAKELAEKSISGVIKIEKIEYEED